MKATILRCVGLATDPNPLVVAPAGGMRVADDVVITASGVATTRPGFTSVGDKVTAYQPRSMYVFNGTPIVVSVDSSTWRIETVSGTITGAATPPDNGLTTQVSGTQFLEARKALYLTSSVGMRKLDSHEDTASEAAGVSMVQVTLGGGSHAGGGTTFPANSAWAYRIVFVRKDSNGYVRRSAPSSRFRSADTAGGDRIAWNVTATQHKIVIPTNATYDYALTAGDQVEFYRTRHNTTGITAEPSPEHYLAFTYTLSATDIANGWFIPPDDTTVDDALGAALYTNPSQLGIANSKEIPPLAIATALWSSCAWYGNTSHRQRVQGAAIKIAGSAADAPTQLWVGAETGNFTSGSANITNVVTVADMRVGMFVTDAISSAIAGTRVPAGTTILSITGAGPFTVGMSANALATAVGVSFSFGDIIRIAGVDFYVDNSVAIQLGIPNGISYRAIPNNFSATLLEDRLWTFGQGLAAAVNHHALLNPASFRYRAVALGNDASAIGSDGPGSFIIESLDLGVASFTVFSPTLPSAFAPTMSSTAPLTSDEDASVSRLYWSEPDEPEAVPIGQYVEVGNRRDPIMALVPLANSLLVFKRDGLYRVTGNAPDGWVVELVDSGLRLLSALTVAEMDGYAWAWCTRGFFRVGETSAQNLTDGVIGRELAKRVTYALSVFDYGAAVVPWRATGCVMLAVPNSSGDETSSAWYCYCATTGAWSRWPMPATVLGVNDPRHCAAEDKRGTALYYVRRDFLGTRWDLRKNSTGLDPTVDPRGYDASIPLGGFTYSAGATTLTVSAVQAGLWTPKPGDWLEGAVVGSPQYRRVVSASYGANWSITISSAFTDVPSAIVAFEGIVSTLAWQAQAAEDPSASAMWTESHVLVDPSDSAYASTYAPWRLLVGGYNSQQTDALNTVEVVEARKNLEPPSRLFRAHVPREIARASHFYPYIQASNLFAPWRYLGIGLVLEPASDRRSAR